MLPTVASLVSTLVACFVTESRYCHHLSREWLEQVYVSHTFAQQVCKQ
jgi:hypothetical protein